MGKIIKEEVNHYINEILPSRDSIFKEMEAYARRNDFPIVGPQVGHLLFQIARIKKPEKIFEMGSGFGYSAYWLSLGAPDADIICTDKSAGNIEKSKKWFHETDRIERLTFLEQDALTALNESDESFDIIFIDVDKHQYPEAFKIALDHLNREGLILIDNVLWSGKVADMDYDDEKTESVRKLNHLLFHTPEVFSSIIPIRDGISISLKL